VNTEWFGEDVVVDDQLIFLVFEPSDLVHLDIDRRRCSLAGLVVEQPLVDLHSSFFDSAAYFLHIEPEEEHLVDAVDRDTDSIVHRRHNLVRRRQRHTGKLGWPVAIHFDNYEQMVDYIPKRLLDVPTRVSDLGYVEIQ